MAMSIRTSVLFTGWRTSSTQYSGVGEGRGGRVEVVEHAVGDFDSVFLSRELQLWSFKTSHIDTGIPGGVDLKVGSEIHQR